MKRTLFGIIVLFICLLPNCMTGQTAQFLPLPSDLVAFDSERGRKLLRESNADQTFWTLAQFYSAQADLSSCSVASSTMVLNALPIERPISSPHGRFRLFTPDNFFTPAVEAVASRKKVSASGMTLNQLSDALACFPVKVERCYASESDPGAFRAMLRNTLTRSDRFVLVNYLRSGIAQESGGHISPLGAYNEKEDMVLILDTAHYKYPWTWVPTDKLWKAMAESVDSESRLSRGFVIVSVRDAK